MKDNFLKNEKGFTLFELVISSGLLLVVLVILLSFMSSVMNYWSKGFSGTSANSSAALAMRKLVLDVQEGMNSSASTDGNTLTVTFPYRASSTGDYVRGQSGVVARYYFSGKTGSETSGNLSYLWKSVGYGKTLIGKNVMRVDSTKPPFSVTNNKLIRVDFKGQCQEGTAITPNEIQQSIKLRNG